MHTIEFRMHSQASYMYMFIHVCGQVYIYIYAYIWVAWKQGRHTGLGVMHEVAYLLSQNPWQTDRCQDRDYRHPTTCAVAYNTMCIRVMDIIYILHHIREPWYLVLDHINNLLIQNCDLAGIVCMVIACNDSMIFQTPFSRPRISIYVQTLMGPLHHTGWHPGCGSCGWKKKIVQSKGTLFSNSKRTRPTNDQHDPPAPRDTPFGESPDATAHHGQIDRQPSKTLLKTTLQSCTSGHALRRTSIMYRK